VRGKEGSRVSCARREWRGGEIRRTKSGAVRVQRAVRRGSRRARWEASEM